MADTNAIVNTILQSLDKVRKNIQVADTENSISIYDTYNNTKVKIEKPTYFVRRSTSTSR